MRIHKTMKFCEKRYAKKMIGVFTEKRNVASKLGGDVAYFERLISKWETYYESCK